MQQIFEYLQLEKIVPLQEFYCYLMTFFRLIFPLFVTLSFWVVGKPVIGKLVFCLVSIPLILAGEYQILLYFTSSSHVVFSVKLPI